MLVYFTICTRCTLEQKALSSTSSPHCDLMPTLAPSEAAVTIMLQVPSLQ